MLGVRCSVARPVTSSDDGSLQVATDSNSRGRKREKLNAKEAKKPSKAFLQERNPTPNRTEAETDREEENSLSFSLSPFFVSFFLVSF